MEVSPRKSLAAASIWCTGHPRAHVDTVHTVTLQELGSYVSYALAVSSNYGPASFDYVILGCTFAPPQQSRVSCGRASSDASLPPRTWLTWNRRENNRASSADCAAPLGLRDSRRLRCSGAEQSTPVASRGRSTSAFGS